MYTAGCYVGRIAHASRECETFLGSAPALTTYLWPGVHRSPLLVEPSAACWLKFPEACQKSMKTATTLRQLPSTNNLISSQDPSNFKKFEKQVHKHIQADLNPRPRDHESRTLRTTPPCTRAAHRANVELLSLVYVNRGLAAKFAQFPAFPMIGKLLKPCSNSDDVTTT